MWAGRANVEKNLVHVMISILSLTPTVSLNSWISMDYYVWISFTQEFLSNYGTSDHREEENTICRCWWWMSLSMLNNPDGHVSSTDSAFIGVFYLHVSNQKKFWIISMQHPIYKQWLKISHVRGYEETKYPISFTSSIYLSKSYYFLFCSVT